MTRYLWHFDAEGWPLERIDTLTGEHVPVIAGVRDESLNTKGRETPMACSLPQVSGVEWVVGDLRLAELFVGDWIYGNQRT
jgi:hypothetical protein